MKRVAAMFTGLGMLGAIAAAQPAPPKAMITPDLRLDANAEDFPRVRFVYVGPRGQMAIPIQNDMNVRMYDSTGRRVAIVGRKGSGPGEFKDIYPIGWKSDTMWVHDGSQRRIVYVAPDNSVLRTTLNETFDAGWSLEERERVRAVLNGVPMSTVSVSSLMADGTIIGLGFALPDRRNVAEMAFGPPRPIVRVGPDKRQTRIGILPWFGDERWSMAVDGIGMGVPFTFGPTVTYSWDGTRVAHMWSALTTRTSGTFTVTQLRANGDTIFARTFPFTSSQIPDAIRDSAIAAQGPRIGSGSRPAEGAADMPLRFMALARERTPTAYAGVTQLIIGLDNTVWVGLRVTEVGQRFLVLNARGDPVASVDLAPRTRLQQASATRLYAIETDADGLGSVVRYRVTGILCGVVSCR